MSISCGKTSDGEGGFSRLDTAAVPLPVHKWIQRLRVPLGANRVPARVGAKARQADPGDPLGKAVDRTNRSGREWSLWGLGGYRTARCGLPEVGHPLCCRTALPIRIPALPHFSPNPKFPLLPPSPVLANTP